MRVKIHEDWISFHVFLLWWKEIQVISDSAYSCLYKGGGQVNTEGGVPGCSADLWRGWAWSFWGSSRCAEWHPLPTPECTD